MKNKKEVYFYEKSNRRSRGITIVEVLFILFIFSLIVVSFYTLFAKGTAYIIESKRRLGATAIASERMEIVKSLDYGQIGIDGSGYIGGDIPAEDQVIVDNQTFHIFSSVIYIDDAYDGIEGEDPDDLRPADYKRVTIKVAWENNENSKKSVILTTDFAPPGVEGSTTGGSLIIKVVDKDSVGIPGFDVHIVNTDLSIDENFETDSNGGVSLPGMPVDGNDYEVSVSKDSYLSIDTLYPYPTSSFLPVYAHASVTDGARNIYSIVTDRLSDINLSTKDFFGNSVPNIAYNLKGGIRKGDTIDNPPDFPTEPIYYFNEDLNSGVSGGNSIEDVSYGDYTFSFTDTLSNFEFVKMSPANSTVKDARMFFVEPGEAILQEAIFADKSFNSTLVTVLDSNDFSPIEGASVRLYNLSLPYDVTLQTDQFGMAFFPETAPALILGDYSIDIQATGYAPKTDTVSVNGYAKKEITLDII